MQLIFTKEDLFRCIQVLQGVAAGRNTLPILSNVLIRAMNGQIEIAATDLRLAFKLLSPVLSLTKVLLLYRQENCLKLYVSCQTKR